MASDLLSVLQDLCGVAASHAAGDADAQAADVARAAIVGLDELAAAEMALTPGTAGDEFWQSASAAGVNAVDLARCSGSDTSVAVVQLCSHRIGSCTAAIVPAKFCTRQHVVEVCRILSVT